LLPGVLGSPRSLRGLNSLNSETGHKVLVYEHLGVIKYNCLRTFIGGGVIQKLHPFSSDHGRHLQFLHIKHFNQQLPWE
jgi:hypothetical protein